MEVQKRETKRESSGAERYRYCTLLISLANLPPFAYSVSSVPPVGSFCTVENRLVNENELKEKQGGKGV